MGIFRKIFRKKEKTILDKADDANQLLQTLGIQKHTESGKQLRAAIAMTLLGEQYDIMDKHSKAAFIKQHAPYLGKVQAMISEDGVLTKRGVALEDKREK